MLEIKSKLVWKKKVLIFPDGFHLQGLEGRQSVEVIDAGLREDDQVVWVVAPQLDKVDGVAEPEGGVAAEHNARLPVLAYHVLVLDDSGFGQARIQGGGNKTWWFFH